MATHVVNIDVMNPLSIARAERQIQNIIRAFNGQVEQFLRELAEIGQRAAQAAYGSPVAVTVEPIDNGMCIRANGDAVVFLEFGAGSAVDQSDMFADRMPFEVRRGSFSDAKGVDQQGRPRGSYARHNYQYWEFGGQTYTEVYPTNGMQHAYEAMMQDIRTLAKRVFG